MSRVVTGERMILPTGADALGAVTTNVIRNLRRGVSPDASMPSTFRLARLVCEEKAPIVLVDFQERE